MQRDPMTGVKGVKPRFKPAKEEMPELSKEYLQIRNEHQRTEMLSAQMELAARRGELVEKRLVQLQAGYLLTVLRQRALALPAAVCDRLAAISDRGEIRAVLNEAMRALLAELQDLPNKIDPAAWEQFVKEQGASGGPEPKPGKRRKSTG